MDRQGTLAFWLVSFIPRIIFLIMVLGSIMIVLSRFQRSTIETELAEAEVFLAALLHSPNGLSAYDPLTGRWLPGIVDPAKLEAGRLEAAYAYEPNDMIAARLELFDLKGQLIKSAFYNEGRWRRWEPIKGIPGRGGVSNFTKELYVLYIDSASGQRKPGWLRSEVLIPNA